jgi:LysM repeat protein
MSARHAAPLLKTPSPASTPAKSPPPSRPKTNTRRSTLKSADEQLRAIKAGDTSWQLRSDANATPERTPEQSRPSTSSSTIRSVGTRTPDEESRPRVRVYLHHVRKTDTLPLIVLAYQISAPVLKKANRLWATDSIQTRDVLYLPVEECGITPEKCEAPIRENTAKAREREDERIRVDSHNEGSIFDGPVSNPGTIKYRGEIVNEEEEWVMIPGIGQVEIIRLPAHKLSYFPTKKVPMERTTSLPTLDALVQADKALPRDSMDSNVSRSSLGSLVEDGVGRVVRFWQDNQGKRKWANIGKDLIEL